MAKNTPPPEGIDEFIASLPPVEDKLAAPELLSQAGQYIQNIWQQGGEKIHDANVRADLGDYSGIMDLATDNAMATVGSTQNIRVPAKGKVTLTPSRPVKSGVPDLAGAVESAPRNTGAVQRIEAGAIAAPELPVNDLNVMTQYENVKKGYADGGQVEGGTPPPPGLDAFVNQLESPMAPEPEGLDTYVKGLNEAEFGTPVQQAITGLEGAAEGVIGPLAPLAETTLGLTTEERIRGRRETNPITHGVGQVAGLGGSMATGVGLGAAAVKGGAKVVSALGLAEASTTAAKVAAAAVRGAVENAMVTGSDEVSRMVIHDPHASLGTAITDVGLSGVLGGVLSGGLASASPLWKAATAGRKLPQTIADFKGRMNYHMENPEPAAAMQQELGDYYTGIRGMVDEVHGPSGLKAQDIAKAVPELNTKISEQASSVASKLESTIAKMADDPHSYPVRLTKSLERDLEAYTNKVTNPEASSSDVFNAIQDLKQTVQGYAKYDKMVKPVDEAYDFVRIAKSLGADLRLSLEDSGVWGKAAERQKALNKGFVDFLPALKDFEKRFTVELATGERIIDPGKVNTYMNQVGKPNAEIKQQMLDNFLKAADKYKDVIHDTHVNLGFEPPMLESSLHTTRGSLKELSTGEKLADAFVSKAMAETGGKGIGAGIGALVGAKVGHPGVGAFIGKETLGPMLEKLLPSIAKPMLQQAADVGGTEAAMSYVNAVAKGESLISKASKSLFIPGREVLSKAFMPTEKDRDKLDKTIQEMNLKPDLLMNRSSKLGHYLPDHAQAEGEVMASAVTYLNNLRPRNDPKNPLDAKLPVSEAQKAAYANTLNIAQQPLIVLDKLKAGKLTAQDVNTMRTLYPALYNRLSAKLTDEMMGAISRGENLPYGTKMGLSLFLGQPMDSTMTSQSILSAQLNSKAQAMPPQPLMPAPKQQHGNTDKLSGFSNNYRTPSQSRALRAQRSK